MLRQMPKNICEMPMITASFIFSEFRKAILFFAGCHTCSQVKANTSMNETDWSRYDTALGTWCHDATPSLTCTAQDNKQRTHMHQWLYSLTNEMPHLALHALHSTQTKNAYAQMAIFTDKWDTDRDWGRQTWRQADDGTDRETVGQRLRQTGRQ